MNKKIFLVETKNYYKLVKTEEDFYGGSNEKPNDIVVVIENVEFIDSETFRIDNSDIIIDSNDLFYFDGIYYGYYNMIFGNSDYTYYCLDGCWYE